MVGLRFGSVCSGVEAASVAWEPLGWTSSWFSEIEPFACSVLAHRFPLTPNLGDMTRYKEWPLDPAINVLIGGTPCQSFSVAGLRKGLDDPRGNLALVFLGIAERYRPSWLLWENVPGVLSSNGGRDFGAFLGALSELGYGWAYRVLDAQHFGVAQQRRRVFVVACLGSGWQRPAAVLFDQGSLQRGPVEGIKLEEDFAGGAHGGADGPILVDRAAFNQGINAQFEPWIGRTQVSPTLIRRGPHALLDPVSGRVRRMTSLEGERLQGFADGWTDVDFNGSPAPETRRWNAIGNSMAVPVIRWIGQRIQMVHEMED